MNTTPENPPVEKSLAWTSEGPTTYRCLGSFACFAQNVEAKARAVTPSTNRAREGSRPGRHLHLDGPLSWRGR